MKYFIYILLFCTLSFTSCTKVLDTKPLDSYTGSDIWSNYSLAEGYMYNTYANTIGYIFSWDMDAISKSVKNNNNPTYGSIKTEQIDRYTDEGWGQYSNIRKVNLILQNVPASPFTDVQKNILLGEAHFLRASIYSFLVFRFGGVQIINSVLDQNSNFTIPRSSLKESYDFVLADLDSAAVLLPKDNERGRATKGAAFALKMRVALQAGAYLNDNSYYTQVKNAGDALFALGKYNLDDYSNLFGAYNTAVSSPENILIYDRSSKNTQFQNTPIQLLVPNSEMIPSKLTPAAMEKFPLKESFPGWLFYTPTQELVDDYLVTDVDGKEKRWDETSYISTGSNVYEKMYKNRDRRFYASVVYDSSKLFGNLAYLRADGNVSANIQPINGGDLVSIYASQTGYLFSKYVYQDKPLWYSDPTDFCYSVLRLGEAYLNYAEACIRLGDEATARIYITKTYQKHGGFANEITSTGEDLWNAYKRERDVEMILENGDRYWSLLRWGMQRSGGLQSGYESSAAAIADLNGRMHGIAISADGKSYQIYELSAMNGLDLKFTQKRYLFPVPESQRTASPVALTQNAGW